LINSKKDRTDQISPALEHNLVSDYAKLTYSDQLLDWLVDAGYTNCFFVPGGNSMYLLDAARKRVDCTVFLHEVSATIAAEYFNETDNSGRKAFVLLTAGPGLTNAVTGIAGAWLENRELLVIGGQVKSSDLMSGGIRQRGIQEIDGISLVGSITKIALRLDRPIRRKKFEAVIRMSSEKRPGPVFLEVCLDVSASPANPKLDSKRSIFENHHAKPAGYLMGLKKMRRLLKQSSRPLVLFGAGVNREAALKSLIYLETVGIPAASTWSGADRVPADFSLYAGRPNYFGMRWSNIILQQADLLIAVGTRLNLQQTGFNWKSFLPLGKIVHVDIDLSELRKGHPKTDLKLNVDSGVFLEDLKTLLQDYFEVSKKDLSEWSMYVSEMRQLLPTVEISESRDGYLNPHLVIKEISKSSTESDVIIPCSSGGTFTAVLQTFEVKAGQKMISNKGLASMGYGLAGAIGASISSPGSNVILFEGDGGFAQNLQELGTVSALSLRLKIVIFSNDGYASIKSTQRRFMSGSFVGCDKESGLILPKWSEIAASFNIRCREISTWQEFHSALPEFLSNPGPDLMVISCDPEYDYVPKVLSRKTSSGNMESNPIQTMWPSLDATTEEVAFRYMSP
jgi:acetolactate synthase-1/2/3 large subunit